MYNRAIKLSCIITIDGCDRGQMFSRVSRVEAQAGNSGLSMTGSLWFMANSMRTGLVWLGGYRQGTEVRRA